MLTHIHKWYDRLTDFQVEMMKDYMRVNTEYIRVSLRLVGQFSHEWIWSIISLRKNDPKSDMMKRFQNQYLTKQSKAPSYQGTTL